jgi:hypothetical protein
MSENEPRSDRPVSRNWEGFAEIDQAIHENRLTEYRLRKAWADPINRAIIIAVTVIMTAFAIFVIVDDVVLQ